MNYCCLLRVYKITVISCDVNVFFQGEQIKFMSSKLTGFHNGKQKLCFNFLKFFFFYQDEKQSGKESINEDERPADNGDEK